MLLNREIATIPDILTAKEGAFFRFVLIFRAEPGDAL
jgi:hypothetical protein